MIVRGLGGLPHPAQGEPVNHIEFSNFVFQVSNQLRRPVFACQLSSFSASVTTQCSPKTHDRQAKVYMCNCCHRFCKQYYSGTALGCQCYTPERLFLYRIHKPIETFFQPLALDGAAAADRPFPTLFSPCEAQFIRNLGW